MKKEVVLQVAREKMLSLYGESLPIEILSRFYSEKAMFEGCELYLTYLDLIGKACLSCRRRATMRLGRAMKIPPPQPLVWVYKYFAYRPIFFCDLKNFQVG